MVRIYVNGAQVAVHLRDCKTGGYTTDKTHLCSAHQHYLDRSPDYYLDKAKIKSDELYRLMGLIFAQNRHPEQLYRTCDGLLNLHRKTDSRDFDKACLMAIEYQNYSYHFLVNILANKMTDQKQTKQAKPLPGHENLRGREYYTQTTMSFNPLI
jgi:hypothetical protein